MVGNDKIVFKFNVNMFFVILTEACVGVFDSLSLVASLALRRMLIMMACGLSCV